MSPYLQAILDHAKKNPDQIKPLDLNSDEFKEQVEKTKAAIQTYADRRGISIEDAQIELSLIALKRGMAWLKGGL